MEDQNDLLRKLLVNQSGKVNPNGNRNSEMTDSGFSQPEVQVSDELLMKRYSITFENEKYVYSGYQYDNLKDAVNYARIFERNSK